MKKFVFAVVVVFFATSFLSAQPKVPDAVSPDAVSKVAAKTADPRIDTLLAMSPQERRDHLRALPKEERTGLWAALQKTLWEKRGVGPAPAAGSGAYNGTGYPLNLPKRRVPQKSPGTIAYDSGFPTIGFGGGQIVGNRFNTQNLNPVMLSGTVSTVQALVVPGPTNTTSSAGFIMLGPQTGGGAAFAIFSTFTGATGVIDSVTFSGMGASYTGSSFFILFGDFANSYIPVFGTGTTLGQGHHGLVGFTGGVFPDITGTYNLGGNRNSYVRATGNIVPVELMTFEIE